MVQKEIQKILTSAGIKDIWSKTIGQTKTTINLIRATEDALHKLLSTKVPTKHIEHLGIREGKTI